MFLTLAVRKGGGNKSEGLVVCFLTQCWAPGRDWEQGSGCSSLAGDGQAATAWAWHADEQRARNTFSKKSYFGNA